MRKNKKIVTLTESDLYKIVNKIISEKKDWIKKALTDSKAGKLKNYCNGDITCKCIRKALDDKKMEKGAQMYLNMNPKKCKTLQ